MRYDNDMMPVEIRAMDLTPGDLVSGAEILDWYGDQRLPSFMSSAGHWRVEGVTRALTDGIKPAVTLLTDAGSIILPAVHPVTAYPVICADCGHPPMDCEFEVRGYA